MTRTRALLFVVIASIATLALGQTYVRPSKGVPIPAFAGYDAGYTLTTSGLLPITLNGPAYEWTAFDAVRVRITAAGTGSDGGTCTSRTMQYTVTDMNTVLRAQLQRRSGSWALVMQDSATATGGAPGFLSVGPSSFLEMTTVNARTNIDAFLGCAVTVTLTPVPFAPGSVASVGVGADGGSLPVVHVDNVSTPFVCPNIYQQTYLMDGGIIIMGVAPSRYYTVVCNSRDNTSGNVRCRADDGGVVTTTAGSIGDVLGVGDCITYSNPVPSPSLWSPIHCIGGGIFATTFECSP